jgi:hypothetical protein
MHAPVRGFRRHREHKRRDPVYVLRAWSVSLALAMTVRVKTTHSRGINCPSSVKHHPRRIGGRRECRVLNGTRSLVCEVGKHTSIVTTGWPKHSGIPCAMVLRFPSCSSRGPGFLAPVVSAMRSIVANLTPASGRQNHTTSPSATATLVSRHHQRPSHPALHVRDDA